jgi:predicted PurR-regulated permease PerM
LNVTSKRYVAELAERLSLEARDPTPFETAQNFWRAAAQTATIVMCVLMVGTLLYLARALLLPVLCAIAVGLTLGPLIGASARRGIPAWLMALIVVLGVIVTANVAIVILAGPASQLLGRAPELGAAFAEKMHFFDRPFAAFGELQAALGITSSGGAPDLNPMRLILGRESFRKSAVSWFASRTTRLRALKILNDVEDNLGGYLMVVTIINLALGVVVTIAAMLMGLPSPILWGALAFALNYIPYVGPAIMDLLLFVVGLLTFPTLLGALLPPAMFMAVTLIEGQFLTPAIVGRRVLNLHPLAIFLSIAFWAWLWGPMGAFLATPILIVARVALSHLYPRQKSEIPG